jgi:hypothetical protein
VSRSRISLISKSDIKYVGILHEINSEKSTVALENVISHGTEGRKGKPELEINGSDQVYEYIVFRGSDVKELQIVEAPVPRESEMPNDPAIMSVSLSLLHDTNTLAVMMKNYLDDTITFLRAQNHADNFLVAFLLIMPQTCK